MIPPVSKKSNDGSASSISSNRNIESSDQADSEAKIEHEKDFSDEVEKIESNVSKNTIRVKVKNFFKFK